VVDIDVHSLERGVIVEQVIQLARDRVVVSILQMAARNDIFAGMPIDHSVLAVSSLLVTSERRDWFPQSWLDSGGSGMHCKRVLEGQLF
jgi:hypothetical protein